MPYEKRCSYYYKTVYTERYFLVVFCSMQGKELSEEYSAERTSSWDMF